MKKSMNLFLAMCLSASLCLTGALPVIAVTTDDAQLPDSSESDHVTVSVVDEETGELLNGVNVKIMRIGFRYNSMEDLELDFSKTETLEEWNTSDANPYTSTAFYYDTSTAYVYAAIEQMPYGYSNRGASSIYYRIYESDRNQTITMNLRHEKYADAEFPITGTYDLTIRFEDVVTHETVDGIDCVLVNQKTGEELCTWNTTETPAMKVTGLEYCFEDYYMKNEVWYQVRFLNLPEEYVVFGGKSREYAAIVYWVDSYEKYEGKSPDEDCVIYLENTDPNAVPYTYLTTSTEQTVTTTETTAASVLTPVFGDVDGDGEVTVKDAQAALMAAGDIMAGLDSSLAQEQLTIADVDGDGEVTAKDAQYILIYAGNTNSEIACTWRSITGNPDAPDESNV